MNLSFLKRKVEKNQLKWPVICQTWEQKWTNNHDNDINRNSNNVLIFWIPHVCHRSSAIRSDPEIDENNSVLFLELRLVNIVEQLS